MYKEVITTLAIFLIAGCGSNSATTTSTSTQTATTTSSTTTTQSTGTTETATETTTATTTSIVETGDTAVPIDTADTGVAPVCKGKRSDLVHTLEAFDASGNCTTCTSGVINFKLTISNPCPMDISFWTPDTCLISYYELVNYSTGMSRGEAEICGAALTEWTVPANNSISHVHNFGTLSPASYEATFMLNDAAPSSSASVAITVVP